MSALDLGQRVLSRVRGSIGELSESSLPVLRGMGLGDVQIITLLAALELGRRRELRSDPIRTLEEALDEVSRNLATSSRETFVLIPLDLRDRCVGDPITLSKPARRTPHAKPAR